jgi:hypothetical protein
MNRADAMFYIISLLGCLLYLAGFWTCVCYAVATFTTYLPAILGEKWVAQTGLGLTLCGIGVLLGAMVMYSDEDDQWTQTSRTL